MTFLRTYKYVCMYVCLCCCLLGANMTVCISHLLCFSALFDFGSPIINQWRARPPHQVHSTIYWFYYLFMFRFRFLFLYKYLFRIFIEKSGLFSLSSGENIERILRLFIGEYVYVSKRELQLFNSLVFISNA